MRHFWSKLSRQSSLIFITIIDKTSYHYVACNDYDFLRFVFSYDSNVLSSYTLLHVLYVLTLLHVLYVLI